MFLGEAAMLGVAGGVLGIRARRVLAVAMVLGMISRNCERAVHDQQPRAPIHAERAAAVS